MKINFNSLKTWHFTVELAISIIHENGAALLTRKSFTSPLTKRGDDTEMKDLFYLPFVSWILFCTFEVVMGFYFFIQLQVFQRCRYQAIFTLKHSLVLVDCIFLFFSKNNLTSK